MVAFTKFLEPLFVGDELTTDMKYIWKIQTIQCHVGNCAVVFTTTHRKPPSQEVKQGIHFTEKDMKWNIKYYGT